MARYILSNRSYEKVNPAPRAVEPTTSFRKVVRKLLRACPGSSKLFRPEVLYPGEFSASNLLVLRKQSADGRDWRFHHSF
jgi:hypothetical protein